jgi:hypothetical protein
MRKSSDGGTTRLSMSRTLPAGGFGPIGSEHRTVREDAAYGRLPRLLASPGSEDAPIGKNV